MLFVSGAVIIYRNMPSVSRMFFRFCLFSELQLFRASRGVMASLGDARVTDNVK